MMFRGKGRGGYSFGDDDIGLLPYMVTGNYQPHLTTLLFLPDPVLLPIRAWCPTFPKSFLETMTPVPWTLAQSLYNLRVCSLTTYP
jgi:hypothetical protein